MGLFDKFKKTETNETIYNCLKGEVISVTKVKDEMFSTECLGKGVGIIPASNRIVSPVDGEVSMVFPTKHAVGIKSKNNTEILIHIGLETVDLEGKPFTSHVQNGQKVKKGQLLIEADFDEISRLNCDTTTMMVITNTKDYSSISIHEGTFEEGETVIEVER